MESRQEVSRESENEDDELSDNVSPTSTLQRGFLPDTNHHGIWAKIRSSLTGKKKELKLKVRDLEAEVERLSAQLKNSNPECGSVSMRLQGIMRENPFNIYIQGSCSNLQVGDNNTQQIDPGLENTLSELEELLFRLTSAVQENTMERTSAELKLKNSEVLLQEMKDSLEECKAMLSKVDKDTSSDLGQLKRHLETLTSDRSDERVYTDGIVQLRNYVVNRRRFVESLDTTPQDVQVAVTRLVNKFGSIRWQKFAQMLGVDETSIQARGWREEADDTEKPSEDLDKDMCARILAQWITQRDENNAEKFISIIKGYEMEAVKEMTVRYQESTVSKPIIPTLPQLDAKTQRYSMLSGASSGNTSLRYPESVRSQLPDHRSRFEHQLEAYKLQVSMDDKLDKILLLLEEAGKSQTKQTLSQKHIIRPEEFV